MDHIIQVKARLSNKSAALANKSLANKSAALVLGLALTTGALGGCASGDQLGLNLSMFSSGTNAEETQAQQQPQAQASAQSITASQKSAAISFAPLIGPPAKVSKSLSGALKSEAQARKIDVSDAAAKSGGYVVKGYLSASPDAKGTKISYIWDVTGSDGKRAHRIMGEDLLPGKIDPKDPWASVDQASLNAIAAKATTQLANWLPSNSTTAVAQGSTGASGDRGNAGLVKQASLTSGNDQTASDASSTKTRGFSNTAVAIIPQVTGAPGDGNQALADALRSQLGSQGVNIGSQSASATHKVIGKISMTPATEGKQTITIKWIVQDAKGRELGTVSQKNTVPAGSLDGTWGQTASHAAGAAAEGIAKLINNGKSS